MAKTIKEMREIMEHYEKGGEVESKRKFEDDAKWGPSNPIWNWDDFDYRIKDQKQKVTIEKWLCRDKDGNFIVIEISPIDEFEHCEKVKLLESYEIEL